MFLLKKKSFILVCFILFSNLSFSQDSIYQTGLASYYSDAFQGRRTSTGEKYYGNLYTAAHKTLPLNTIVKVTNLKNNKSVIVKINDRCAYSRTRIIDLSKVAAKKIDIIASGVAKVKLEIIKPSDLMVIENISNILLQPSKTDTVGGTWKYDIYGLFLKYKNHFWQMQPPDKNPSSINMAGIANATSPKHTNDRLKNLICMFFAPLTVFGFTV